MLDVYACKDTHNCTKYKIKTLFLDFSSNEPRFLAVSAWPFACSRMVFCLQAKSLLAVSKNTGYGIFAYCCCGQGTLKLAFLPSFV
jgi:hypothetical protein